MEAPSLRWKALSSLALPLALMTAEPVAAEGWGGLFSFPAGESAQAASGGVALPLTASPAPEQSADTLGAAPERRRAARPEGDGSYPEAVSIAGIQAPARNRPALAAAAPQPGNGIAGDPAYDQGFDTGRADGVCLAEILAAQERYGIPGNLLLALGLQEAGFNRKSGLTVWPWSVNAAGEGRLFKTRSEALNWVRQRQAQGVSSIDIGCMQINQKWHPDAFPSLEAGFDPGLNVDYAARFLVSLHEKTGDWLKAAGSYHSFNPGPQGVYLASLKRNIDVANARFDTFAVKAEAAGGAAPLDPMGLRYAALDSGEMAELTDPGGPPKIRHFNPLPKRPGSTRYSRQSADSGTPAPLPPELIPRDGAFWSASLAGDDSASAHRTLYSSADLEPVLPHFTPTF